MSSKNQNLNKASKEKNDEFYTQLVDIEKELKHYRKHFKNKVVYCNCDNPETSQFFHYFYLNFHKLGIRKLISSCYNKGGEKAIYLEYEGESKGHKNKLTYIRQERKYLEEDGDFKNFENIELLQQADIIVTNPPFSLFREFVTQLMEYDKKFLILGSQSAIVYKDVFHYIKEDRLWLGVDNGGTKWFEVPEGYDITTESRKKSENGRKYFSMGSIMWYTNLDTEKRHKELLLIKEYNAEEYPTYDNYKAIEVSRYHNIPKDFSGVMGVPITFLDKYNPDQFEILGCNRGVGQDKNGVYGRGSYLNGKETFKRLFIRNKLLKRL